MDISHFYAVAPQLDAPGDGSHLPPLYDGHAPIGLHLAFQEAIDLYEDWPGRGEEPKVMVDGRGFPIGAVFVRMAACTDLMPRRTFDAFRAVFAEAGGAGLDAGKATFGDASHIVLAALSEHRSHA